MCGIAGFNWKDSSVINAMAETLRHRGPDDRGVYLDTGVSLGHTRLAILDLSQKGHQPMHFENLTIVYNGEIYNFQEIRDELQSLGYKFTSGTDTEVILAAYHRWGDKCVEKFNGMWALCIYDRDKQTLFLSRDRFGIKPIYYYFDGRRFIFASELKAIKKHGIPLETDPAGLNFFFYQKYIGGDFTIYKNCRKLRPSESLLFDLNTKKLVVSKHYDLENEIAKRQSIPIDERLGMVEEIIEDAVLKRLIADVPVGSFLSGGVDSSLISAIISKNKKDFDTFSIGFKDQSYNELEFSKDVAEHIRTAHHYEYMDVNEDIVKQVIGEMDEPFGDSSVFPTYLLSKITRQKVTVSLSGDAGDEVFGGYDTYMAHKLARYVPASLVRLSRSLVGAIPPSDNKVTLGFKMKRFVRDFNMGCNRRHLNWMGTFADINRGKLLGDCFVPCEQLINCTGENSLLSVQLNDIHNYLAEDILKKVDLASMLVSLEARVPYLDYRLVPLVLSLPEKYKIRLLTTKWLLKKIASRYLPRRIVHRPKRGFTVPVSTWIKTSALIREFLTNRSYYQPGLLDYDYAQRLFDEHISRQQDNARELWLIFVFNYWTHRQSYSA
ncbi:MAG: asparagine synthase (glutamine-hydrolyzing) [Sedimentisphaerales bacterium]|nr:asparagine synthase (glutamine-hydrolyzing) [Sedimentisphaerales bacterium]